MFVGHYTLQCLLIKTPQISMEIRILPAFVVLNSSFNLERSMFEILVIQSKMQSLEKFGGNIDYVPKSSLIRIVSRVLTPFSA